MRLQRFLFVIPLLFALNAMASVPPPAPPGTCSDFQLLPFPQTFPGPTFTLGGLSFINPTSSGAPMTMQFVDRTEDRDFRPELNVAYSLTTPTTTPLLLRLTGPMFPNAPTTVWIDLMHFNRATVIGLDASNTIVASATQPNQKVRAFLTLSSQLGIRTVRFEAVETLLYRVCWR